MILVTGAAGFIGAHTLLAFAGAGHQVIGAGRLRASTENNLRSIERITGARPKFVEGEISDRAFLEQIFDTHEITAVVHLAGIKGVKDSIVRPLDFYENEVGSLLNLLRTMDSANVKTIIFGSSANIYGDAESYPVVEATPGAANNAYGRTKIFIESILRDVCRSSPDWRVAILRYFNPVGAHSSGLVGEPFGGSFASIFSIVARTALGMQPMVEIFGVDFETDDGSAVRDFVHVMDLAESHLAVLNYLKENPGVVTLNIASGKGVSVLEIIRLFERLSGQSIQVRRSPRRSGDLAISYADITKANQTIGWWPKRDLETMCLDTLRWQVNATTWERK